MFALFLLVIFPAGSFHGRTWGWDQSNLGGVSPGHGGAAGDTHLHSGAFPLASSDRFWKEKVQIILTACDVCASGQSQQHQRSSHWGAAEAAAACGSPLRAAEPRPRSGRRRQGEQQLTSTLAWWSDHCATVWLVLISVSSNIAQITTELKSEKLLSLTWEHSALFSFFASYLTRLEQKSSVLIWHLKSYIH